MDWQNTAVGMKSRVSKKALGLSAVQSELLSLVDQMIQPLQVSEHRPFTVIGWALASEQTRARKGVTLSSLRQAAGSEWVSTGAAGVRSWRATVSAADCAAALGVALLGLEEEVYAMQAQADENEKEGDVTVDEEEGCVPSEIDGEGDGKEEVEGNDETESKQGNQEAHDGAEMEIASSKDIELDKAERKSDAVTSAPLAKRGDSAAPRKGSPVLDGKRLWPSAQVAHRCGVDVRAPSQLPWVEILE